MKLKMIIIGLSLFSSEIYAAEVKYSISPMPITGYGISLRDINDSGDVVGAYERNGKKEGFVSYVLNDTRTIQGLGFLPGHDSSIATAINDSGNVVGYSRQGVGNDIAFIASKNNTGWSVSSVQPSATYESRAFDINNKNEIVGRVTIGEETSLFVSSPLDQGRSLESIPFSDGVMGQVARINDNGIILANTYKEYKNYPVIVSKSSVGWESNTIAIPEFTSSRVFLNINNSNQVLGYDVVSGSPNARTRTFFVEKQNNIWEKKNLVTHKLLDGHTTGFYPSDINDFGVVVGYWSVPRGNMSSYIRPYVFVSVDGEIKRLTGLVTQGMNGWTELITAEAINNKGQIVGMGNYNGVRTAYILTPIVLPESLSYCEMGSDPGTTSSNDGSALWWWIEGGVTSAAITDDTDSFSHVLDTSSIPSDYVWFYPTETATYTLRVNEANGAYSTCNTKIFVIDAPFCEMGADPEKIKKGEGAALWWWIEDGKIANIKNSDGSFNKSVNSNSIPSDYIWFYPEVTSTYTMTVTSKSGATFQCKTTIDVTN